MRLVSITPTGESRLESLEARWDGWTSKAGGRKERTGKVGSLPKWWRSLMVLRDLKQEGPESLGTIVQSSRGSTIQDKRLSKVALLDLSRRGYVSISGPE